MPTMRDQIIASTPLGDWPAGEKMTAVVLFLPSGTAAMAAIRYSRPMSVGSSGRLKGEVEIFPKGN
jgi:hypothetical protein